MQEQSIKDFELGPILFQTRSAEGLDSRTKSDNRRVLIWRLRQQLSGSDAKFFTERLEFISSQSFDLPMIHLFGVDSSGIAYVVTDFPRGERLAKLSVTAGVREQIFMDFVRNVAAFHARDLVLGDLCEESILIDELPRVHLLSFLGCFEMSTQKTLHIPPKHTLRTIAPEQRVSGMLAPTVDVYALGILGYRIITGKYPVEGEANPLTTVQPPSSIVPEISPWMDDVIGRCLEFGLSDRYHDAVALYDDLQKGPRSIGIGRWSQRALAVTTQPKDRKESLIHREEAEAPSNTVQKSSDAPVQALKKGGIALFALVIGLGLGAFFLLKPSSGNVFDNDTEAFLSTLPPGMKVTARDILNSSLPLSQRDASFSALVKDENPLILASLEGLLPRVKNDLQEKVFDEILVRYKDLGLGRTAVVLRKKFPPTDLNNPHLRDAIDASDPLSDRLEKIPRLQRLFQDERELALVLCAALALDADEGGEFLRTLRQFLTSVGVSGDVGSRDVGALVLTHPSLIAAFEPELPSLLAKMGPNDLGWSAGRLVEIESPFVRTVSDEILRRELLPPYQRIFLEAIVQGDPLRISRPVMKALVRASQQQVTSADISALSGWTDEASEKVLSALCVVTKDDQLSTEAFESLSSRGVTSEPGKSLVTWIRSKLWESRAKLSRAVGIFSLSTIAGSSELEFAFGQFLPFSTSGSFFSILIKSDDPRLTVMAVERLSAITMSDDLLPLLQHPNMQVRIATVKALVGRNDVKVLQYIQRGYEKEKDPAVRAAYQELHWVRKE
jgi:serine/threonine protein kinase